MTLTTDTLIIKINRLEHELKETDAKMESASGYKRRKIYRTSKEAIAKQLNKARATLLAKTAKK